MVEALQVEVDVSLALLGVVVVESLLVARALPTSKPRNVSSISTASLGIDEDGVVVAVVDVDKGETEEAVENRVRLNELAPRGSVYGFRVEEEEAA